MNSISVLFLLLFSSILFSQKFSDQLNIDFENEVCDCLGNSPEQSLNTVGQCIDNWTNKYGSKFTEYIDFNSKTDPQKQFNKIATEFIRQNRENLIINCNGVSNILETLRTQLFESDKKNYETLDINELNKMIEADQSTESLLTRAKYYFYHNDFDKAKTDFRKILETNPENQKAIYFLGRIYESQNNYLGAIDYYQQLIKITRDETYLSDIYLVKKKMKDSPGN